VHLDVSGDRGSRTGEQRGRVGVESADGLGDGRAALVDQLEPPRLEEARVRRGAEVRDAEASALLVRERRDLDRGREAIPARTPSGPSKRPASGTVSRCEPTTNAGRSTPSAPA
jgi:hypothetical protein